MRCSAGKGYLIGGDPWWSGPVLSDRIGRTKRPGSEQVVGRAYEVPEAGQAHGGRQHGSKAGK
jgi:hypothetical protein